MRYTKLPNVLLLFVVSCQSCLAATAKPAVAKSDLAQPDVSCQLTVSAAASLTQAFTEIAGEFSQLQPCRVQLNFAASGVLLQQLRHGAPTDVLVTADEATMDVAAREQLLAADSRQNFISNRLVLIAPLHSALTPADSTAATGSQVLASLATAQIQQIALGDPKSVPAGRYAQAALTDAGLWPAIRHKVIPALNVRQVLAYVSRAEVDAGFVYASELKGQAVKLLAEVNNTPPILYPAAVSQHSNNPVTARQFVAFLLSVPAQQILQQHGFQPLPVTQVRP